MKTFAWILLIAVLPILMIALLSPGPAGPEPIASISHLMHGAVIPAGDILWEVPVEAPRNDEEWLQVESNAAVIAEAGRWLMEPERAKDQDAWIRSAQTLMDAGKLALAAAHARNVEGLIEAGDVVYEACEGCHEIYLEKEEEE